MPVIEFLPLLTKSNELIAFVEGRVDHAGNSGNVDIVYKISQDVGKICI